jgi:hypothetical protein
MKQGRKNIEKKEERQRPGFGFSVFTLINSQRGFKGVKLSNWLLHG